MSARRKALGVLNVLMSNRGFRIPGRTHAAAPVNILGDGMAMPRIGVVGSNNAGRSVRLSRVRE
jgi:hypothetical protein